MLNLSSVQLQCYQRRRAGDQLNRVGWVRRSQPTARQARYTRARRCAGQSGDVRLVPWRSSSDPVIR